MCNREKHSPFLFHFIIFRICVYVCHLAERIHSWHTEHVCGTRATECLGRNRLQDYAEVVSLGYVRAIYNYVLCAKHLFLFWEVLFCPAERELESSIIIARLVGFVGLFLRDDRF